MNKATKEKSGSIGIMAAILLIGTFACVISQMLLTTALPKLMTAFDVNTATVNWLTTGFLLVNGIMIPISGYLGRRFNTKWLFITSMSIFMLGTIIAYVSPNFGTLFIGRMIQAGGTGIMMPLLQTVMFSIFPPEKRGAAMGMLGIVIGVAPAIGPTLSGWIVDNFNWRVLFGIEIPIVVMVIIAALFFLHPILENQKEKLDGLGVILSTIGFGTLLYGFSSVGNDGWSSATVIISLIVGIIGVGAFTIHELKTDKPLLDMRVFKFINFSLGTLLSTAVMIAMFGVETILPIYLQNVHGLTALDSGLTLLIGAVLMALMSPITGKAFDKFGARRLAMLGMFLLTLGTIPFMFLNANTPVVYIVAFYSLRMFGIAMVLMPVTTYGMNFLPAALIADETAANNTVRQVGGSIGSAIIVSILSNVTESTKPAHHLLVTNPIEYKVKMVDAVINGYHGAFLFAIVFGIIAFFGTFISFIYIKNIPFRSIMTTIFLALTLISTYGAMRNDQDHLIMTPQSNTTSHRIYATKSNNGLNMMVYQNLGSQKQFNVQTYRNHSDQKKISYTSADQYTKNQIKYVDGNQSTLKTTTKQWHFTKAGQFWFGIANMKFGNDQSDFKIIKRTNTFYIPKKWIHLSANQAKQLGKKMNQSKSQSTEQQQLIKQQGQAFVKEQMQAAILKNPSLATYKNAQTSLAKQFANQFKDQVILKQTNQIKAMLKTIKIKE